MEVCIMLSTGKTTFLYGVDCNDIDSLDLESLEVTFVNGYSDKELTKKKRVNVKHICYIEEDRD